MPIPDESVFELSPPRRPGLDDLGGAALEDDPVDPPDPDTMPSAGLLNQLAFLVQAYGMLMPLATVEVDWNGVSPPAISMTRCLDPSIQSSDFTFNVAGTGDYTLDLPAGRLPVDQQPMISVTGNFDVIAKAYRSAETITIKVVARGSGSGAHASFKLLIF